MRGEDSAPRGGALRRNVGRAGASSAGEGGGEGAATNVGRALPRAGGGERRGSARGGRGGVLGQFARHQQARSMDALKTEAQDWLSLVNRLKNALDQESTEVSTIERCLYSAYTRSSNSLPKSPVKSPTKPPPSAHDAPRGAASLASKTQVNRQPLERSGPSRVNDNNSGASHGAVGGAPRSPSKQPPSAFSLTTQPPPRHAAQCPAPAGNNWDELHGIVMRHDSKPCSSAAKATPSWQQPLKQRATAGAGAQPLRSASAPLTRQTKNQTPSRSTSPLTQPGSYFSSSRASSSRGERCSTQPTLPRCQSSRGNHSAPAPSEVLARHAVSLIPPPPALQLPSPTRTKGPGEQELFEDGPTSSRSDPWREDARHGAWVAGGHTQAGSAKSACGAAVSASAAGLRGVPETLGGYAGAGTEAEQKAAVAVPDADLLSSGHSSATTGPSDGGMAPSSRHGMFNICALGGGLEGGGSGSAAGAAAKQRLQGEPSSEAKVSLTHPRVSTQPPLIAIPSVTSAKSRAPEHPPRRTRSATPQAAPEVGDAQTLPGPRTCYVPASKDEEVSRHRAQRGNDAASRSGAVRPGTAGQGGGAGEEKEREVKGVQGKTRSVYSGGARALLRLRRDHTRRTPEQVELARALRERVRSNLDSLALRDDAMLDEHQQREQRKEDRRIAYLESQGLTNVKSKVWELPEPTEKPLERPAPRPPTASREVRHAANKAIRRKNQNIIDSMLKDRQWAMEMVEEEEAREKERWAAVRRGVIETLQRHREERAAWGLSVAGPPPLVDVSPPATVCHDSLASWRRHNGVPEDTPVFVWNGSYGVGVRGRLLQRGWVENRVPQSPFFNLQWTLRGQDICFDLLNDGVLVNHFQGSDLLTTKSGLNAIVRTMNTKEYGDAAALCPRSYDPCVTSELQEFLEDYHWSTAEALLRLILNAGHASKNGLPQATDCDASSSPADPTPGQIILFGVLNPTIIRWALFACQRRLRRGPRDDASGAPSDAATLTQIAPGCTSDPGAGIDPSQLVWLGAKGEQQSQRVLLQNNAEARSLLSVEDPEADKESDQELSQKQWEAVLDVYEEAMAYLVAMGWRHVPATGMWTPGPSAAKEAMQKRVNPQLKWLLGSASATVAALDARWPHGAVLNGPMCAWMVKPAQAARGEGVKSVAGLKRVLEECLNGPHRILQKYMESPLLVRGRKVDIRQWVLVTSVTPLKVYFFNECLIRFAGAKWHLHPENITDVRVHLCNHTLQAQLPGYNAGDGLEGDQNMWGSERMKQYLDEETSWGASVWEERVVPAMKKLTLRLMQAAAPTFSQRDGCFELFGLDFLLDRHLRVWLLEVNESPDLRPRTPAKSAACSRMLDGLISIVVDDFNPNAAEANRELLSTPSNQPSGTSKESVHIGGWDLLQTKDAEDLGLRVSNTNTESYLSGSAASANAIGRVPREASARIRPVTGRPLNVADAEQHGARGVLLNGQRILSAVRRKVPP